MQARVYGGGRAAASPIKTTGPLRVNLPRVFVPSLVFLLAAGIAWPQEAPAVSYSQDVLPVFQEKCWQCHGELQQQSGLDMRGRESILRGGKRGPSIVPGKSVESPLYRHISGMDMPVMPLGGEISLEQIATIRDWIDQGAKFDSEPPPASSAAVNTNPGGGVSSPRDWWAFQKPVRDSPPRSYDARWSINPIDAFIQGKLDEKGLKRAPRADKRSLIRRAYLDLVGLLPGIEEVEAFVHDDSPDPFEAVVERLLASPGYGERWGRHWLDVIRYADSGGYEHDFDYPHAWRYRDYVIDAFNSDKPYDQFIREQLAGDELDNVTFESLIATGFYRVGPRVGFREKDNPEYRYNYLDDLIGTTSRAFMALTVDCARCHNHKFDPISQREYYRMMAVFFPFVNYDYPLASPDEVAAYEKKKAEIAERARPLKQRIGAIEEPYRKIAFEKMLGTFPHDIQVAVRTPQEGRTPGQQLLAAQILSIGPSGARDLLSAADAKEIERLGQRIAQIENELPRDLPFAMGVRDGDYRFAPDGPGDEVQPGKGDREFYDLEGSFVPRPGEPYEPPAAHLLPSADYHNKGPEVQPGFLDVLTQGNPPTEILPSGGQVTSGRRRALAEWIASPDHPLTARVMVNRIWQHHFGRGIVATAGNFGHLGQLPTHPALLDWLATEFVRRGWSVKQMHRLMMTSEAYRMSSAFHDEGSARADPRNNYLWRFRARRLEAEIIRDVIIHASGNLNAKVGGEPFFPPVPKSVWESFGKGRWELTEEGPPVWRRSIYSYWKRGLRYPMFDVFDQPNPNVSCERRVTTTVATQALTLLNSEFVLSQAAAFARRVQEAAGKEQPVQVKQAYWIALSRDPSSAEIERNVAFLNQQFEYHQKRAAGDPALAALTDLCNVILNLNEFLYLN